MFRKNTAGQFIHFQGVDSSTGGIKSGVTWTVRRCIDGTFAAATGTVTEDGTTGWYKFAMSQADTNGNNIGFNFTGTGAIPQTVNIVTTVLDPTSTSFGLSLAKTTNITGFNDIAATAVVSSGAITTSGGAVSTVSNVTTVNGLAANVITAASMAADASAEIADAVWDEDATAHQTQGTFGQAIGDPGADTDTIWGLVNTNLDAAVSSRLATAGYTAPDNANIALIKTDTTAILIDTGTTLDAAIAAVKADTAAILIDTTEIGVAGAGLTAIASQASVNTVDTVVDAIKVKTDQLTFTVANVVDSNVNNINDVPIVGNGSTVPFNV